jgi:hypothetical protein
VKRGTFLNGTPQHVIQVLLDAPYIELNLVAQGVEGCIRIWPVTVEKVMEFLDDNEAACAKAYGLSVENYRLWMERHGCVSCQAHGCKALVTNHGMLSASEFVKALADPYCPKHGGSVLCTSEYCEKHRKGRLPKGEVRS